MGSPEENSGQRVPRLLWLRDHILIHSSPIFSFPNEFLYNANILQRLADFIPALWINSCLIHLLDKTIYCHYITIIRQEGIMNYVLRNNKREEYCSFFHNLWHGKKPLFKMFRTDNKGYLYDTGTNKIFECDDLEFFLINNLAMYETEEAFDKTLLRCSENVLAGLINNLIEQINKENILKTNRIFEFGGSHFSDLNDILNNAVEMIQLEVTERCNLRCSYCLYNQDYTEKRNHGSRDMTKDVAFKAIDHLAHCSRYKKKVAVTFYGGEPLLCFPFIRECIQYAKCLFLDKEITFSITTNATLITPEIAHYLSEENVGVNVSIDGPQDIHDKYRKSSSNTGSFERAMSGLKILLDAYFGKIKMIGLNMVYTQPYSAERLTHMAELWNYYPWLPNNIRLNVAYAIGFFPNDGCDNNSKEVDLSYFRWAEKRFLEDYRNGKESHPMAAGLIEREIVRLYKRPIHNSPVEKYFLNGCCVPSMRKRFVSVDGTLVLCERIGKAPVIGNINDGVDIDIVRKIFIDEYAHNSIDECSNCWARQICSICYMHTYKGSKYDNELKSKNCSLMRIGAINSLLLFCKLLEINKNGLDYMADIQMG